MIETIFNVKTDTTFVQEVDFLQKYTLHCLEDGCKMRFEDYLPDNFLSSFPKDREPINFLMDNKSSMLRVRQVDGWELFGKEPQRTSAYLNEILDEYGSSELDEGIAEILIKQYGREAFGLYLPFHFYYKCNWGIYLFPELIRLQAVKLHKVFKKKISIEQMKAFYMIAMYRHELFHYETERFVTKLEITTRNPHYIRSHELYQKLAYSEHWLEEALAEASVLNSRLIKNRTGIDSKVLREIYEYDLKFMPPGYRDYDCKYYGGPDEAHKYFAAQLIEMNYKPQTRSTEMHTVKSEFSSDDFAVPLYFVTGFNNVYRMR
jgi:hypothetical protein